MKKTNIILFLVSYLLVVRLQAGQLLPSINPLQKDSLSQLASPLQETSFTQNELVGETDLLINQQPILNESIIGPVNHPAQALETSAKMHTCFCLKCNDTTCKYIKITLITAAVVGALAGTVFGGIYACSKCCCIAHQAAATTSLCDQMDNSASDDQSQNCSGNDYNWSKNCDSSTPRDGDGMC